MLPISDWEADKCESGWVSALDSGSLVDFVSAPRPIRCGYSMLIWVGYGPLFVAPEKGFFAKEGVAVELVKFEDHTAAFAGLFAGQVDAITAGTQDVLTFSEPDEERLVCVLPLDESVAAMESWPPRTFSRSPISRASQSRSCAAACSSST